MKFFSFLRVFRNAAPRMPTLSQWSQQTPQNQFPLYSRAYQGNEIVFSAIEMLATSAGEPHIVGRKFQRESPTVRNEEQRLLAAGHTRREVKSRLIKNGFYKELPNHPLIRLLEKPNPWMSRGQMWGTVVMDEALAGNSYWVKVRFDGGPLRGAVRELWRLRPDRVRVIPSATNYIEGYEYNTGTEKITFPAADIIHFKTRNPLNDYYGMPPLMPIAGRVDIDDYMKTFLRSFFERGGAAGPGAILSVKGRVSQEDKDAIRERFRHRYGQPGELLILDNAESTYTQAGLNRGLRDALPKELDAMQEARIAMAFGIPGSILGLLIGYESSSYANKRQDWQVLWDLTMTPKLSNYDDVLNLQLVPEFGQIDEVHFDLSDIHALQEDVDKIHARLRANWQASGLTWEEYREGLGYDPNVSADAIVIVPSNMMPVKFSELGEMQEQAALPPPMPSKEPVVDIINEVHCPKCGRWVGRNMNVGATAYCPKDKEVLIQRLPDERAFEMEYDDDGRVKRVLEVVS